MKKFIALSILGIFSSLPLQAIEVGDRLPSLILQGYPGKIEIKTSDLIGKVSIFNFWATWCETCKVELKEMQSQFSPLRKDSAFQIAYVTLDKEPEKAKNWVQAEIPQAQDFLAHMYIDSHFTIADQLKVDAFPMTLVVGKDGKVKFIQRGFKTGEGSTERIAITAQELLK